MQYLSLLLGAAALITPAIAQTWTSCNPLNTTCPNDPALGTNTTFYFNQSSAVTDTFNITAGSLTYGSNGTEFTIAKKGDSPTIQSQWYIFFGRVSVIMKASSGQGIVSSVVLESDDLDEVDWEFMGGNGTFAETNYFGKGNTTDYNRAIYYPVNSDLRENFHNYTVHWTSAQLEWYIDSVLVRTLPYAAANGGNNYPQTPMTLRIGIWAGGDTTENSPGTVEWAGGPTDYSKGPFTMNVQSAEVHDFSTGSAYEYVGHSGSWESIKTIAGNSTAANTIMQANTPSLSVAQKFAALPAGTKLAIYCGGGAAGAVLFSALLFICIRQRRAGRREREAYNAKVEQEREAAFKEQTVLNEKGLGGWDSDSKLGEDALGGWSGSRGADPDHSSAPPTAQNITGSEMPLRSPSAVSPNFSRVGSPTIPRLASPAPSRVMSPQLVSPIPQKAWNGNVGGMMNDTGNDAYSGGYGGPHNFSRSPSFPSPQTPQPGHQDGYFNQANRSNGGYQRF